VPLLTSKKNVRMHFESFARYIKPPQLFHVTIKFMLIYAIDRKGFEKNRQLDKKDFNAIEYLLRKGQRQLEIYASPGIKDIR
jgi:hypothetical protein